MLEHSRTKTRFSGKTWKQLIYVRWTQRDTGGTHSIHHMEELDGKMRMRRDFKIKSEVTRIRTQTWTKQTLGTNWSSQALAQDISKCDGHAETTATS